MWQLDNKELEQLTMETAGLEGYSSPVNQLLTYGEAEVVEAKDWPNYQALGLGPEHISELIRMATDEQLNNADSESLEVWAPMHAWRALGQLHAEAAAEPLLSLFDLQEDSEWVMEELPEVFGMIGPAALPVLAAYLADSSHAEWPRVNATTSIEKIAQYLPEARSACVEILSKQLEQFQETEYELNAFLIMSLVHLKATETAPLIERAFEADAVETFMLGDWEDVQEALGLLSPEEVERRKQRRAEARNSLFPLTTPEPEYSVFFSKPHGYSPTQKKAKNKSKMAKQSRKKNRKR